MLSTLRSARNASFDHLTKAKSFLSMPAGLLFPRRLGASVPIGKLVRAAKRTKESRPLQQGIWKSSKVFDYYLRQLDNGDLTFKQLTIKIILLLLLTTGCRPQELSTIDMRKSYVYEDKIELSVFLKTFRSRKFIAVTAQRGEGEKLCPVACINRLKEVAETTYAQREAFLLNTQLHT